MIGIDIDAMETLGWKTISNFECSRNGYLSNYGDMKLSFHEYNNLPFTLTYMGKKGDIKNIISRHFKTFEQAYQYLIRVQYFIDKLKENEQFI